jgi:hypothetical protein
MSKYSSNGPWFKHYRKKLPKVLRKLDRIATLDQITKEMQLLAAGAKKSSIRIICEACSANCTGLHNQYYRNDFDPEYHFLLKIAPGIYAMPNPKYLDLKAIYRMRRTIK